MINNIGIANPQGWGKYKVNNGASTCWVYIKNWGIIKDSFIDVNNNVYENFPDGKKCFYVDKNGYMITHTSVTKNSIEYKADSNGYLTMVTNTGFAGVSFLGGKSAWYNNVLKDANGNNVANKWANESGSDYQDYFKDGKYCYRSDDNGRMIVNRVFTVGAIDYRANDKGKCSEYNPEEEYKVDSSLKNLDVKIVNWIQKNPNHNYKDIEWINVGGGDWAFYVKSLGGWQTNYWDSSDGGKSKWYWLGANGLMFRNCKAYGTTKTFSKITTNKSKAYKENGIYFECSFADDGLWEMSLDDKSEFESYLASNGIAMNELSVTDTGKYFSAYLNQAEKASLKSIIELQEKAEKENSSKEVEKLDEQVNNEFSLPIEIYTKDQFYKGKYSTGQVGEKEYLTNGYYIYNKGSNKYTLYKANDTIGKTSKVIKSNVSLAKIADYIDDNDIEKSAEVKEKSDSSSSSSSKSSSKKDKKLKVTIKSGYKTKDKTVNEVEYEGSYTLPTFEEMGWTEKPKYTFSHWAIGSKKYNPGDTIDNIKSKKTITAKWKKD